MVNSVEHTSFLPQVREFFVNPVTGSDEAEGSQTSPYQTITHALRQISSGTMGATDTTVIRLSAGTYSTSTGEVFPLIIPAQTSILGDLSDRGQHIVITGGGTYNDPTFGLQNITLLPQKNTHLRGVTVTNPALKGTGLWLEATAAVVRCHIINCGREGIFITGTASPTIADCLLQDNQASGISFTRHARGEIRRSLCQRNRFGLVMSDHAAPLLLENQFIENQSGIVLVGAVRPVLRHNRIERNANEGLIVSGNASPDLGHPQDPAHNCLQANGQFDLRNTTARPIISVGNDLNPMRVEGAVELTSCVWFEERTTRESSKPAKGPLVQRSRSSQAAQQGTRPSKLLPVFTPPSSRFLPPTTAWTNHWADPFIHAMRTAQVIDRAPNEPFDPDLPISPEQFARWMSQTLGEPFHLHQEVAGEVADREIKNPIAVQNAQANNPECITAFSAQTVHSSPRLTRLQAIVLLVKRLGLAGGDPGGLMGYRDRAQIPSFAVNAVAAATQSRLVVLHSDPTRLAPLEPVTQAEAAAMLYQGLVYLGQAAPIASPHIVHPIPTASFADIGQHWASDFIRGVASRGKMGGSIKGEFEPEHSMTRADYAMLLTQIFQSEPDRPAKRFADVPDDLPARLAIEQVYCSRLMAGFADNTFRPDQPVTRAQVLLSLVIGLGCPAADPEILDRYEDTADIPATLRSAMATATAQWLVVNYPQITRLQPHRSATRAEIAAMVYQALVRLGQAPAVPSPYIVDPRYPKQHKDLRAMPIVVLDPGHGGSDPGVVAVGATAETASAMPAVPSMPAGAMGMPPGVARPDRPPGFPGSANMPLMPPGSLPPGSTPIPGAPQRKMPPITTESFGIPGSSEPRSMPPLPPGTMGANAMEPNNTRPSGTPGQGMTPPIPPRTPMPPGFAPPGNPMPLPPRSGISGIPTRGMPYAPPNPLEGSVLREKEVVLSIAQAVASLLQQQGIQVLLTRSIDRNLDLSNRVEMAEQVNADVFVSLHANATSPIQPEVNGIETYHSPNSRDSIPLAQTIHTAIVQALDVTDRGIRAANFYGLRSVSMPAVSIEVGYLTGKEDGLNLANSDYREQLAQAIAKGILQYVRQWVQ